jgi:Xylose isomerase-like TIM barrel.
MSVQFTRRAWTRLVLSGMAGALLPDRLSANREKIALPKGFVLGVQSYSFRDRSLEAAIKAMKKLGLTSCELWEGHVIPQEIFTKRGEALRKWRLEVSLDYFHAIRDQFNKAGIALQAYNGTIKDGTSDEEIDRTFEMTKALGTNVLTSSATVSVMKRIDPYARQHEAIVAMHNHDKVQRPNEFSTPQTFARGMEGLSEYIRINLDIGHFTAANCDPVDYMKKMHEKIVCIHVKDRKKDHGPRTPFGEGDTPIAEVLRLIRDNQWNIPANIELEYPGDPEVEMKRCIDYCRKVLEA